MRPIGLAVVLGVGLTLMPLAAGATAGGEDVSRGLLPIEQPTQV
jgi:hypothetical protein